jgi:hypothetical protein
MQWVAVKGGLTIDKQMLGWPPELEKSMDKLWTRENAS